MADLADKAEEVVTSNAPHVIDALRRIRFLIIGIPLLSVLIGVVTQAVIPERHIVSATFKVGSFAQADAPTTAVPLAGEQQMIARMRATGRAIRDQFEGSLLLTTILSDDVMTVTATAKGDELTRKFLSKIIDKEVAFHNGRLDKLIAVQDAQKAFLENQVKELNERVVTVTEARDRGSQKDQEVGAWVALQQARMDAQNKIATHRRQLNAIDLARASDLFVDTSAVVQTPVVIVTSRLYRPLLYGAIGLGIGVGLTILLIIVSIVRALTRPKPTLQ